MKNLFPRKIFLFIKIIFWLLLVNTILIFLLVFGNLDKLFNAAVSFSLQILPSDAITGVGGGGGGAFPFSNVITQRPLLQEPLIPGDENEDTEEIMPAEEIPKKPSAPEIGITEKPEEQIPPAKPTGGIVEQEAPLKIPSKIKPGSSPSDQLTTKEPKTSADIQKEEKPARPVAEYVLVTDTVFNISLIVEVTLIILLLFCMIIFNIQIRRLGKR